MAHLEFCIPATSRDELVQSSKKGQYVVRRVLKDPSEIEQKVEEYSHLVLSDGAVVVYECFDVFYSVCEHFLKVEKTVREEAWKTTLAALAAVCEELGDVIDNGNASVKKEKRSILKMWTYLAFQLLEAFENDITRPTVLVAQEKGKRGKKKAASPNLNGLNWAAEEERVLRLLSCVTDLELCQLWDPPSVAIMDSYSNLVASCCYKMLESPSAMKEKTVKEELFQLLGLLVKKYNQTLSMSLKFVQLLQVCEHLVVPIAQALEHFAKKFEVKAITSEVVREIGRKDPRDLALDSGGTKMLASFLVEVAQRVPEAVYPSISCLLPHLGYESYTMRNGVLGVLGEMLSQVLRPDKMDSEQMKSIRDQCLDRLEDHIHDVNAFVRSRCLQIWQQLAVAKAIPVGRLVDSLLVRVCGRLQDKSSIVRKSAVQFLSTCLQGNPYSSNLNEAELTCKLREAEEHLRAVLPGEWQVGVTLPTEDTHGEERERPQGDGGEEKEDGPSALEEPQQSHLDEEREEDEGAKQVAQLTLVVKYFKHALSFTRLLSQCVPTVSQLLGSKCTSDVTESLEFLCTAQEFGLPRAEEGIRKALALVWSGEGQVRDLLISTYTRLYLTSVEESPRAQHRAMCDNLIRLVSNLTVGEHVSLEQLLSLMVSSNAIPQAVITILWDMFTGKSPGVTPEQSLSALVLLTMTGGADRELILGKFDVLVSLGLRTRSDSSSFSLRLARQTCLALQKLVVAKKTKGAVSDAPFRLPEEHVLFQRLTDMMVQGVSDMSHSHWVPFAEEAVATIYCLAEHPDRLSTVLLMRLCHEVAPSPREGGFDTERPPEPTLRDFDGDFDPEMVSTQDPDAPSDVTEGPAPPSCGSAVVLGRLLSAIGCVAHHQLLHLEHATLNELKRRARLKEGQGRTSPTPSKTPRGQTPAGSKSKPADQGTNEEEEMMGAVAEDLELELIHRVCEEELLAPLVSLLGCLVPVVTAVCKDPAHYNSPMLQSAAALALSKIMLISSRYCDENLQLLVTLMEKSPEPVIRANAIVALGDLTFRFPNLIEPWTPHLYARLVDESLLVRQNTLTVLSHLILNDMVKVKGHISNIALCLEDEEPRIADLAKLFFHELAKKGNAVYNILPDVISRLSDPQSGVPEELFNNIVKYLMVYIQKEKQSESLVEKLCFRFRATRNERQWQDIAQCLAQLPFSERCLRKLQENFACFQDKLGNERVYASFMAIVGKCKKFAKPEVKAAVEELEKKLDEAHKKLTDEEGGPTEHPKPQQAKEKGDRGDRDATSDEVLDAVPTKPLHSLPRLPGSGPSGKPAATTATRSSRRVLKPSTKTQQRKATTVDSEDEEQDYVPKSVQKGRSKVTARSVRQGTKPSTARRKKRVNRLTFSSDEEEDGTLNVTRKNIFPDDSDIENTDPLCL